MSFEDNDRSGLYDDSSTYPQQDPAQEYYRQRRCTPMGRPRRSKKHNNVVAIILIVLLIPVSRFLVGTGSGVTGSFVALVAGTVPFFARQIESVLADIDHGLIEASQAMGFSPREIIFSVYLRESIPGITRVTMITFVSLVGITAIAGAIGAGGLGDFAIRYGYQMGYRDMIWLTVIIILLIISVFQFFGNIIIKKSTH